MIGTARLTLLYFTLLPTQRVISVLGLGLALLGGLLSWRGAVPGPALAMLGAVLVVFPMFCSAGYVLRRLSVPRTHRLIPHFRRRLLLATCLIAVVPATFGAVAEFASSGDALSSLSIFVYGAALFSVVLWFLYVIHPASLLVTVALIAALVATRYLLNVLFPAADISLPEVHPTALVTTVAGLMIAGWCALGWLYLRSPGLLPFGQTGGGWQDAAPHTGTRLRTTARRRTATGAEVANIYLRGHTNGRARTWAETAVTLLVISAILQFGVSPDRAILAIPFIFGLGIMLAARGLAARARLLWLKGSWSRPRLFGAIERELVCTHLPLALIAVLVVAAFSTYNSLTTTTALLIITASAVASAACAGYVTLAWAQGARASALAFGLLAMIALVMACVAVLLDPVREDLLLRAAAIHTVCALASRMLASRHSPAVDWLTLKPPSMPRAT